MIGARSSRPQHGRANGEVVDPVDVDADAESGPLQGNVDDPSAGGVMYIDRSALDIAKGRGYTAPLWISDLAFYRVP